MMTGLKSSLRALRATPGFTAVAVLTLAVCIASNASIFSVYDKLVLNPVDVPDPSSLVAIWTKNPIAGFTVNSVSWPRFVEIARASHTLSSVDISVFDAFTLTGTSDQPQQLNALRVSAGFFHTLGVSPERGRDFTPAEDVPNGPRVCILSHDLWTGAFGRRSSIVGETVQLDGQPWQVVGVMPAQMTAPFAQVQVYTPRVFEVGGLTSAQVDSGAQFMQPIARLAAGVTLDQATAELQAISQTYRQQFGGHLDATNISFPKGYVDSVAGNLKPTFYTLLGAVAFVLLIACGNVASLFVGRLSARQKEIAIQRSLGATQSVIVRGLVVEGLLVASVAGLVGAGLAKWALRGIAVAVASQIPPNTVFSLNWHAWSFIVGVALASGLLVGLLPALHASRGDLVAVLKDATRGSSSARGGRVRSLLIVAEVALSVVLLVGSSLLLLSFVSLERTAPGFDPAGVATAFVNVPAARYPTPAQQVEFYEQVLGQLRTNPQVSHATASLGLPVAGFFSRSPYGVLGQPVVPVSQRPLAVLQIVSEDFFATLRIPFIAGRAFDEHDRTGSPNVCIINQTLAHKLFPGQSALGKSLTRGLNSDVASTVVGVINDVKSGGLNAPVPDEIYYPMRQLGRAGLNITARTSGDAATLQRTIQTAVSAIDRDQPISFFQSLDSLLSNSLGIQRIVATLTGGFAAIALILAAIGLYSVVAYAVALRTGEIGIRMALGAQPGQVLRLIMGGGLKLVGIGVVLGLAGAAATTRLIQTLLSNVQPLDPVVYGSVTIFFGLVAAAACFLPSLRASKIDPLLALTDRRTGR
jgi:predicted permease